jgi:hypothetical protein
MILQLSPFIPLETERGRAMAHFLIDPGTEHHIQFVTFIDETGECWTFEAKEVRLQRNQTSRPERLTEPFPTSGCHRDGCQCRICQAVRTPSP